MQRETELESNLNRYIFFNNLPANYSTEACHLRVISNLNPKNLIDLSAALFSTFLNEKVKVTVFALYRYNLLLVNHRFNLARVLLFLFIATLY